ncbi:hypothetical protein PY97_00460 [Lacticaseibacillus rhamnosus]|nr:hypothetical protein LaR308_13160 [Lacticaseibacillus rhamnosus]KMO51092.1 hypothetical protein PY97_00460 [Lacticaseibacillus rhamnosus]OAU22453.1 hypothetical protein PY91_13010 [Lacticaseibacillus rhamnosus]
MNWLVCHHIRQFINTKVQINFTANNVNLNYSHHKSSNPAIHKYAATIQNLFQSHKNYANQVNNAVIYKDCHS